MTNTDARFKIISLLNNIVIERGEQYAPCKRKAAGGSAGGWEAGIYGKRLPGSILKSIAASLGVTTGAIYRYYTDKEALFDGLVREPAHELVERYRTLQQTFAGRNLEEQLQKLPEVPDKEASWMMDFLYDHFDAFKLIACCSSGTKYEHYLDTLAEIEDHSGRLLVDRMVDAGYPIRRLDDELIHIMSTALFNGMFETIRHDMPREKAMVYMDDLRNFYSAGWFRLLGIPFE